MKNGKILIVDDEPKNLKILKIRLENEYELAEASSGEEALEKLKFFKPAVILLDVMMGGIDGFETTRKIREIPHLFETKIILVSGKAMIDDKLEGYSCGANDYITKPFNGEELRAKVNTFMKMYETEMQLKEVNSSLEDQVRIRTEQLLRSERLAFVGRHACDIVHNLKNPLAILKMNLGNVESSLEGNDSWTKMNNATDRILDIIKDILSTNSTSESTAASANPNPIIEEELELLRLDAFVRSKIEIVTHLEAKSPIAINPVHFHQVIGNLIKNSAEALYGTTGGKLAIKTEDLDRSVRITIQDNGPGIPPENIAKVFQPLFTTKKGENGGPVGNGLGLSYSKRMVESYHGELDLSSIFGKGTKITIVIPKAKSNEPVSKSNV